MKLLLIISAILIMGACAPKPPEVNATCEQLRRFIDGEIYITSGQMAEIRQFATSGRNDQIERSVEVYFANLEKKVALLDSISTHGSSLRDKEFTNFLRAEVSKAKHLDDASVNKERKERVVPVPTKE